MWYHPLTWIHLSTCFGPACFTLKSPYIAIVKNRHLHHEVLAKLGKLPPLAPRNSVSWKRRGRGWWLDLPCLLEWATSRSKMLYLVGWFQTCFMFIPILGEMLQFWPTFFKRLKPPIRGWMSENDYFPLWTKHHHVDLNSCIFLFTQMNWKGLYCIKHWRIGESARHVSIFSFVFVLLLSYPEAIFPSLPFVCWYSETEKPCVVLAEPSFVCLFWWWQSESIKKRILQCTQK